MSKSFAIIKLSKAATVTCFLIIAEIMSDHQLIEKFLREHFDNLEKLSTEIRDDLRKKCEEGGGNSEGGFDGFNVSESTKRQSTMGGLISHVMQKVVDDVIPKYEIYISKKRREIDARSYDPFYVYLEKFTKDHLFAAENNLFLCNYSALVANVIIKNSTAFFLN